jgi:LmbE family N-acetylglucosaminyl deacetylase
MTAMLTDGPLCPPETVCTWGRTLVAAPHPDDDVLGCGGAIGLLQKLGLPVHVVFVSDGAASHPNSRKFPPPIVRALREKEAQAGLAQLGVSSDSTSFLRLPDGALPEEGDTRFAQAVELCAAQLNAVRPDTLLLPWRRDPHPDHRATSQLFHVALGHHTGHPRVFEYPVWAWERAAEGDMPYPGEARAFRLDIQDVVDQKQKAIWAHQSQITPMIDDDPDGCLLTPEMLAHFARPGEVYLEVLTW